MATYTFLAIRIAGGDGSESDLKSGEDSTSTLGSRLGRTWGR